MKVAIVLFLFLVAGCSKNPVAPQAVEHSFSSGDITGDFSVLMNTTDYYEIGDGAEITVIVGMKNALTIKDNRPRSLKETNPITAISYSKNDSLLSDTGKQAILSFAEGKNNVAVKIVTKNSSSIINTSIFSVKGAIPQPISVPNSIRGVLTSDRSIQEEFAIMDSHLAMDSAEWATVNIERIAQGYWFINRRAIKGVSENGTAKKMYQFINSGVDKKKYAEAIDWAYVAIMYSSLVNNDSVESFYLRFIIESPHLKYADDNRQSFNLLKKRDQNEFLNLISDIKNNSPAYADKDSLPYLLRDRDQSCKNYNLGSESLVDIAKDLSK